ncbi:MAG: DNA repair protein RadC [archaeon]
MKIKDISPENQPRNRLLTQGIESLSDAEVLAIILEKGTKQENVVEMSNRLIAKYGMEKLSELSIIELQEIKGIGPAKAMQIACAFELSKRHRLRKNGNNIRKASDVHNLMRDELIDKKKEYLYALYLNSKNQVIDRPEVISIGILDASIVHPREIFSLAVRKAAKAIILVHNHPSGDYNPSEEDKLVTERIRDAGKLMDIELLDHVIIGDGYYSFRERGMID